MADQNVHGWTRQANRAILRRHTLHRRRLRVESLEPRHLLAANLVISEFMASNSGALLDGDGNSSDWIEVRNAGVTSVNLADYFLTDTPDELSRWAFPPRIIIPGEHLVVFASSPSDGAGGTLGNYMDAGGNLHTNFSLDAAGEYLALTFEDPTTHAISIVHEYAPQFPPQQSDISYGVGQITSQVNLVSPGAAAKTIVPTTSGYDAVWNSLAYTPDANWINGTTGVGFGQTFNGFSVRTFRANIAAGSPIGNTVDNIDEALEVIGNPLAQSSVAAANHNVVNLVNNTTTGGNYDSGNSFFPGLTGADANHFVTEVHAVVTIPTPGNWTFGVASNEGFLLIVDDFEIERFGTGDTDQFGTFNFAAAGEYELHLFNFERTGSTWLELFAAPGSFTSWNAASFDLVGDTANGGLAVKSDVVGSSGASINQLLGTNVQSQMLGVNSSFYTRIEFNADNPTAFDQLKLRMKYDDAFVAYLNGQEVARRNFTGTPAWNSIANSPRTGSEVVTYEDIDISLFLPALVTGKNVLAIQGINITAADTDALIVPELIGTDIVAISQAYFTAPTPRAANGDGLAGFVEDTKFTVDRGFFDAPFQVEIATTTSGAQIYYTTNGTEPTQATGTLYTGPININKTTTLRAAAFLAGYLPTNADTQTYFFVDDIVQQTHANTLSAGFPTTWGSSVPNTNFPAGPDYGLDPDIVGIFDANGNPVGGDLYGGIYADDFKEALLSIPTMSIVMNLDDLFSASAGIYTNASQRGVAWERPTSVEWITADGSPQFQVDAGIRIQGAFFRSNNNNLKKSFRLLFKNIYGPGKLDFPLFEGSIGSYNTLVLRGGGNDGYTWNSAKLTDQYTRDQFMRDLQLASGHPSPDGNFAHLYINGVYWGLYNPVERPDNEFAASYFGGVPENWDVVHRGGGTFEAQNGDFVAWNALMTLAQQAGTSQAAYMQLQGKNLDGTSNPATPPLLALTSYIDYIIVNAWGGNWDWPRNNFWAARDRDPLTTTGFHFFNWDSENTIGNNRSRSPLNADVFNPATLPGNDWGQDGVNDNAGRPHLLLRDNPEYRMLFADRVHRLFFNDGILEADNLIERYEALADSVELAMIGESARWGDMQAHRSPGPNRALTPADWSDECNWILGLPHTRPDPLPYLPNRSDVVMAQLMGYGFYPSVVAPTFSQHGGLVPPGFDLAITAPAGAVWYTLDGSDPRMTGSGISPTAVMYGGTPVDIPVGMTVRARALNHGVWSALNEAAFFTLPPADSANLRVTELQYHPADHPSVPDDEDLEFIELVNISDQAISLAGVQLREFASTPFTFGAATTLAAGERIIVARNPAAFVLVYGSGINVASAGFSPANFSNGGERVHLVSALGQTIVDFTYGDAGVWTAAADGTGSSLEIVDPMADASDPANWRASFYPGGTPGTDRVSLPGDYDRNRVVNTADYSAWRANFGQSLDTETGADGNADGVVDAADYVAWRRNVGTSLAASGMAATLPVPVDVIEPTALSPNESQDRALAMLFATTPPTGIAMRSFPLSRRANLSSATTVNALADHARQLLLDLSWVAGVEQERAIGLPTAWGPGGTSTSVTQDNDIEGRNEFFSTVDDDVVRPAI